MTNEIEWFERGPSGALVHWADIALTTDRYPPTGPGIGWLTNGFVWIDREDQADEYRDLKKDLEQTAKNCRILQFKLRKAERRMETLEVEKQDLESKLPNGVGGANATGHGQDRIKALEKELAQSRDQLAQAQRESINLQSQLRSANKDPVSHAGPVLSKSRSLEVSPAGSFNISLRSFFDPEIPSHPSFMM